MSLMLDNIVSSLSLAVSDLSFCTTLLKTVYCTILNAQDSFLISVGFLSMLESFPESSLILSYQLYEGVTHWQALEVVEQAGRQQGRPGNEVLESWTSGACLQPCHPPCPALPRVAAPWATRLPCPPALPWAIAPGACSGSQNNSFSLSFVLCRLGCGLCSF